MLPIDICKQASPFPTWCLVVAWFIPLWSLFVLCPILLPLLQLWMVLWWDPPSSPSMFLRNARASELQLWSLSLLSAAQNSGLSQWYTAPQCLPCCAGLCILILFFSSSLILFDLAHVSFPFFFSWLALHLKGPPFTAFSGHPLSLFQSLWGILVKVLTDVYEWQAYQHHLLLLHTRIAAAFSVGCHVTRLKDEVGQ